jgi:hypothetical protein
MAFSPLLRRVGKAIILNLLIFSLMYLGIFLYFDVITIPYLSPAVVVIADSLSPFTPLWNPAMAYINLKQWLHPIAIAHRASLKRRHYVLTCLCQSIAAVFTLYSIALNFSWVMETVYGLKSGEGMCVGPCWKVWTQTMLLIIVVFAEIAGWELDGGLYVRFMDRQIQKFKQDEARNATEETFAHGGEDRKKAEDMEKA